MAARKRSRRKRTSAVGKTVENSMAELRKSLDTLRRMLEGYLPLKTRRRSKTTTRRSVARQNKRTGTRRRKRTKRAA
jgi:hypothetical protein